MLEKLACKLGHSDEEPNIALAKLLCQSRDEAGVGEIVGGFNSKDNAVASDCVKVLYEIGYREPLLIAPYAKDFIARLKAKNNRLVWGSMIALSTIADLVPDTVYEHLPAVIAAYESGSVITVDNAVSVFAKLCKAGGDYRRSVFPILVEHLGTCRPKEVAQHAERAAVCVDSETIDEFTAVLEKRKPELTAPQLSRVNRLLKRLR